MSCGYCAKGAQYETVRKMYAEEVEHAQYLADQIRMLGGEPKLDPDLSTPPTDVRQMLDGDSKEERADVKNYMRLAELAEQENLIALKMQMEEQAADEDEHGLEMQRLLG